MPVTGSLLIVHLVEKQPPGYRFSRYRDEWPLHITLVPWFEVKDYETLVDKLSDTASRCTSLIITVGGEEQFGREGEVPVNVIVEQEPMRLLHDTLMKRVADASGNLHENIWTGNHFRAHITRHESAGRWATKGDKMSLGDFTVVVLCNDDICEVGPTFNLAAL